MKARQFWQQDSGAVYVTGVHEAPPFQVLWSPLCAHVNEKGHSLEQGAVNRTDRGSQMSINVSENNNLCEGPLPQEPL